MTICVYCNTERLHPAPQISENNFESCTLNFLFSISAQPRRVFSPIQKVEGEVARRASCHSRLATTQSLSFYQPRTTPQGENKFSHSHLAES
jgi:hypothetical protein